MDENWQSALTAAKAAAKHDAQIAQQIKDDAAEAQCIQDLFDSFGPDLQIDETNLTTGPFESPSSSATVCGPCHSIPPTQQPIPSTIFHYGDGYATYELPPSFEALYSQLLPPASALDTHVLQLLLPGMNHALAP